MSAEMLLRQFRIFLKSHRGFATAVDHGKIEVEGSKLYWERHGNGNKPVLFCPGLVGSIQSNYWPVFKKMDQSKFTLIGIDPEGYGKSRPPDRNAFTKEFCLKRDARLAAQVMEQLGYEKYSVVGWSNGGMTAVFLAALFPNAVSRTVMCNTPMWPSEHNNIVMDQILKLDNWSPRHRKDLLRVYEQKYAVKILRDWRFFVKREMEKPKHFAEVLSRFCEMKAPLLFIYGTKDAFTSAADAWTAFEEVMSPGDSIHLVRNGSHFHLEFIDEFVDAASDFLAQA